MIMCSFTNLMLCYPPFDVSLCACVCVLYLSSLLASLVQLAAWSDCGCRFVSAVWASVRWGKYPLGNAHCKMKICICTHARHCTALHCTAQLVCFNSFSSSSAWGDHVSYLLLFHNFAYRRIFVVTTLRNGPIFNYDFNCLLSFFSLVFFAIDFTLQLKQAAWLAICTTSYFTPFLVARSFWRISLSLCAYNYRSMFTSLKFIHSFGVQFLFSVCSTEFGAYTKPCTKCTNYTVACAAHFFLVATPIPVICSIFLLLYSVVVGALFLDHAFYHNNTAASNFYSSLQFFLLVALNWMDRWRRGKCTQQRRSAAQSNRNGATRNSLTLITTPNMWWKKNANTQIDSAFASRCNGDDDDEEDDVCAVVVAAVMCDRWW